MNYTKQAGGRREGAGRPPTSGEGVERHTVTLRPSDVAYLKRLDAQLSAAIRKLIDRAKEQG